MVLKQENERNPNLAYQKQTNMWIEKHKLKGHARRLKQSILHEINKAKETKNSKLGYLDMSMRAHTKPTYAYVYFKPAYACKKHAHVDTPQTLTQKHAIDINKSKKQIKIYTKEQKVKMNTLKQKLLGLIFDCFPQSNLFTNQ